MRFIGISRVFSTENDQQYETIGAFWDEMSEKYGRENLRGLGYNWTNTTIEYVIGKKEGIIDEANCDIELPDQGWTTVRGKTEELGRIYEGIYADGCLTYEIESFGEDGSCEISYTRAQSV
jgi:predicted transcriptional regulator YdeE